MSFMIESIRDCLGVFTESRDLLTAAGIPHVIGGGLAVGVYGHRRPTKDIDFFIPQEYAEDALETLGRANYHIKRSDPDWLYQSWKEDVMVDLVFGINTSRGRIMIDNSIINRGSMQDILGTLFKVIAPEDLIIFKILVQHENRADWWDAITILRNHDLDIHWHDILRYAYIDPVKVLSFLLFTHSRHLSENLFPDWVLEKVWKDAAEKLSLPFCPA